jgi:redox-sensing transcriptional repressor
MKAEPGIPWPSLRRLPLYYRRLAQAREAGEAIISSEELARSAGVSAAQVRKDFSYLTEDGRPGVGYDVRSMAGYLEEFLGLANDKEAVLAGVGNLGRALALYPGFARYGLQIVALFDDDPNKIGQTVGERQVLPIEKLTDLARRLHIQIGIIAVPAGAAQAVADAMIAGGIRAIWNFAPCRLAVPDEVIVKHEDLAAELATLSHAIEERRKKAEGSKAANP